jgi:hypothetical protein
MHRTHCTVWIRVAATLLALLLSLGCGDTRSTNSEIGTTPESATTESKEIYGVVTKFEVTPVSITHDETLSITMNFKNVTDSDVRFYISGCIVDHLELLGANGNLVAFKNGAPISECPRLDVWLNAGGIAIREMTFRLGEFYSLSPGTYYIHFRYDRRLMEKSSLNDNCWSKQPVKIEVKDSIPGKRLRPGHYAP